MNTTSSKKPIKWWFIFTIIGAMTVGYFAADFFISSTEKKTEDSPEKNQSEEVETKEELPLTHAPIVSPHIPEKVTFAGSDIPLDKIGVREQLDRELVINCYWHSNTIFYMKRAGRWFPLIEKILKEQNIPEDFKYLALIESGLDNVVSPAGAAGFWQFMRGTGIDYGLEINSHVDERYHPEKATYAAGKYLHHAHQKYDDWILAAASYNMGKAGLSNRLEEQKVSSYFDLLLNSETARYVYRMIAIKLIFENPEQYGFMLENEDLYQPYNTRIVSVEEDIEDWVTFALEEQSNYKTLKLLNPWLRSKKLPVREGRTYQILLPKNDNGE